MVEGYVYYVLSAIAVIMMTGPILKGMRLTMDFLSSLSKSKKHDSIDRYNDLHGTYFSKHSHALKSSINSSFNLHICRYRVALYLLLLTHSFTCSFKLFRILK